MILINIFQFQSLDHDHDSDNGDHHVHFDPKSIKDDFEEDNTIVYQKSTIGNSITIHLGFLQIDHRYKIELKLPKVLISNDEFNLTTDDSVVPNINCKLTEFLGKQSDKNEYYEMNIEFLAHKEKLLKEELNLKNAQTEDKFKFIFYARVLGRGKGTPMLKKGIHLIGVEADPEDTDSDYVAHF